MMALECCMHTAVCLSRIFECSGEFEKKNEQLLRNICATYVWSFSRACTCRCHHCNSNATDSAVGLCCFEYSIVLLVAVHDFYLLKFSNVVDQYLITIVSVFAGPR